MTAVQVAPAADIDQVIEKARVLAISDDTAVVRVMIAFPAMEMLPSERQHVIDVAARLAAPDLGSTAADLVLASARIYGAYAYDVTFTI